MARKPDTRVDTHWLMYDFLFYHGRLAMAYRMLWDLILCQPDDQEWTTQSFLADCEAVMDGTPSPERIGALLEHAWLCGVIHSPQPDNVHFLDRIWKKPKNLDQP